MEKWPLESLSLRDMGMGAWYDEAMEILSKSSTSYENRQPGLPLWPFKLPLQQIYQVTRAQMKRIFRRLINCEVNP